MTDKRFFFGGNVKAVGGGKVEGYLVYFTDESEKDLQGEYFDANTEFFLDQGYPVKGISTLYHHGLDETVGVKVVGKIADFKKDDVGLWVQAQLDMRDEYEKMIYKLAEERKLGWSSGALPQSVRVTDKGYIKSWAIIEASLTPTPAMPKKTEIMTVKSLVDLYAREQYAREHDASADDANATGDQFLNPVQTGTIESTSNRKGASDMARKRTRKELIEEFQSLVEEVADALIEEGIADEAEAEEIAEIAVEELEQVIEEEESGEAMAMADEDEETKAEGEEDDEEVGKAKRRAKSLANRVTQRWLNRKNGRKSGIRAGIEAAKAKAPAQPRKMQAPQGTMEQKMDQLRGWSKGAPTNIANMRVKGQFGNLSPQAISWVLDVKRQLDPHWSPDGTREGIKAAIDVFVNHAEEQHAKGKFYLGDQAYVGVKSYKANELDHTTNTNAGAEWIWESWRDQIWEKARQENVILSNLNSIELLANVDNVPVEWTDPTVYYVPETTAETELDPSGSPITSSKLGTENAQFSAKKLALRVAYSAEELEDSIIRFAEQNERQSRRAMLNAIDSVLANGDTTTGTTNINNDGGSIAAGTNVLAFDGMIHLPLITDSDLSVDGEGNAITLAALRTARFLMGSEFVNMTDDILLFLDNFAYKDALGMDEFITMDKAGALATAQTGQIGFIDGIATFATNKILPSATNGKVSSTAASNTRARALFIYKPYWWVGFRRQITSYLGRTLDGEAYQLSMTTRLDLQTNPHNNGASLLYNIGA